MAARVCYLLGTMAATASLLLAGCGSEVASSGERTTTETPAPGGLARDDGLIEVDYGLTPPGDPFNRVHVVTDGRQVRVRYYGEIEGYTSEELVYVWDGTRIMEYSDSSETPYTVYDAPREHRRMLLAVKSWADRGPDPSGCLRESTIMIIDRPAVGYRCPTSEPDKSTDGSTMWLDQASGVLLKSQYGEGFSMTVRTLDLDPEIDETTFSTRPPSGAEVKVVAALPGRG